MPKFRKNVSLLALSNFKIGGPARFFFEPKNEAEIRWAIGEAKARHVPVFILGGATNLLIDDKGFRGLVLKPDFRTLTVKGTAITVGAAVSMADLLKFSVKKSLSGLEWAGGLPGLLGGAVRGNAGCFGGEIKDVVKTVRSFDTKTMKIMTRSAKQCAFRYRDSIFKKMNGREIILDATLHMKRGNAQKIAEAIQEKIEYRLEHHPLEYPNIGSIFKNVALTVIHKKSSPAYKDAIRVGRLEFRGSPFSVKMDPFPVIATAKLISEAGLRGTRIGGAMFSEKHPNYIVNVRHARSGDVKKLIKLAKRKVREKFGVQLEEEAQIWEFK